MNLSKHRLGGARLLARAVAARAAGFTATGSLTAGCAWHTATLLPKGQVPAPVVSGAFLQATVSTANAAAFIRLIQTI